MKELTKESLEDAIAKIHNAKPGEIVEVKPSVVLGSVSQAAALAGVANRIINPSIAVGTMAQAAALAGVASNQATVRAAPLKNHGKPVEIRPFEVYLDMEMLNDKSSAYNVDPETLANLWVVRFGKDWVDAENIGDEDKEDIWWRHAANRLRELGYLEMHTLASSYRVVLRIVE